MNVIKILLFLLLIFVNVFLLLLTNYIPVFKVIKQSFISQWPECEEYANVVCCK